ncbi:leucine-rich repeat domain-containing protein [Clostridium sp. 19966]|uniref:C1 family peptidase n=1 Tax=Clostridium sp. 19966 TaxID=2768166 RepID=UPI0028DF5440|nr:C1 family peptidase [Clostridium sp. 19966]MDT8716134.1 leucine-rich repeat domain-containing protein [Clostridium sp. 19966]
MRKKALKKVTFFIPLLLIFNLFTGFKYGSNTQNYKLETKKLFDTVSATDHKKGYIPENITIPKSEGYLKASNLPTQYDSRSKGYITSVKNQGSIGDCWAFATMASMEATQLKNTGVTYDFSEINMSAENGTVNPDDGGNYFISTYYLTSWKGPVIENEDPYPSPATPDNVNSKSMSPRYHVQDVIFLPSRTSAADNDAIKNAVVNYGAVATSYYDDDSYRNSSNYAYYNNGTSNTSNHAVTIVGWDDNYPASNFKTQPAGNGAFLIKNSWGSSWGNSGYFYISYYDVDLGYTLNTVYDDLESKTNYSSIYQLTDKMSNSYYKISGFVGNKFTAKTNDSISAAGFETLEPNAPYEIYLDKLQNGQVVNPTNKVAGGTLADAGFHTVKFSTPVSVSAGESYVVSVKLGNSLHVLGTVNDQSTSNSYSFGGSSPSSISQAVPDIKAYGTQGSNTLGVANITPANDILASDASISVNFNKSITQGTSYNNIALKDKNGKAVSSTVSISGSTLTIKESPNNQSGKLTLYIPKDAVKSSDSLIMADDYTNDFTVPTPIKILDPNLESAVRSRLNKSSGDITDWDMKQLTTLSASNDGISSLKGLEYAVNLKQLDVSNNKIASLEPLKGLTKLIGLNLDSNRINDLYPIKNLTSLQELSVDSNGISDANPISNLTKLGTLYLNYNCINDLSFVKKLTNLTYFDIYNNFIKDISPLSDFANNNTSSSVSIDLDYNNIDTSSTQTKNVLSTLQSKNISCSTDSEYKGLLASVNNMNPNTTSKLFDKQSVVINFNDAIKETSSTKSNIDLYDSNYNSIDFTYKISGSKLIIIPSTEVKNTTLNLSISAGAVTSASNLNTQNEEVYAEMEASSSVYGDANGDGAVDAKDLAVIGQNYNSYIDDSGSLNDKLDLNSDGYIDIYDVTNCSNSIK